MDSGGRQLHQRVLASGRGDPQPQRVQNPRCTLQARGALAQRKVRDHVRRGYKVKEQILTHKQQLRRARLEQSLGL